MITKIQRWGNSQGIRLSKETLASAGIEVGEMVDVSVNDGVVIVKPANRVRGGVDLAQLIAQIPEDHEPEAFNWGDPAGNEVW